MQQSALLSRLESQMVSDVVRVGLSGVFHQQSIDDQTGSRRKLLDLCDQLKQTGRWLSVRRLAELVDAHPDTVRTWILCDGLPAHKFRRRWKAYGPSVAEWLESRSGTTSSIARVPNSTARKIPSRDSLTETLPTRAPK